MVLDIGRYHKVRCLVSYLRLSRVKLIFSNERMVTTARNKAEKIASVVGSHHGLVWPVVAQDALRQVLPSTCVDRCGMMPEGTIARLITLGRAEREVL